MSDDLTEAEQSQRVLRRLQQFGRQWAWEISWPDLTWRAMRGFVGPDGTAMPVRDYPLADILALYGPRYGPELETLMHQSIQSGDPIDHVSEYDLENGQLIAYQTNAEVTYGPDGAVSGMYGLTRDVSEQRKVERELRLAQAQLERAQQLGRMGHWQMDYPSGALIWSDALFQMIGLPREQGIRVERFLEMIDPDQLDDVLEKRDRALKSRGTLSYTADLIRPDGTRIVIETIGEPEFGPDGKLKAYFGTTQDITRRVVAEREARQNEQRLQHVFDAMDQAGVGIGIQDNEGLIVRARPALLTLTGFDREEQVLGKRWSDLQGEGGTDIRTALGATIQQAIAGNSEAMSNAEVDWVRPDGRKISAMVRLAPLPDGQRTMIVLDQTEQKKAQAEVVSREMRTTSILTAIDAAGVGFTVEDKEGRIISVSPSLQRLLSIEAEHDLLGEKWTEIFDLPTSITSKIAQENLAYDIGQEQAFAYPEFELTLPSGREISLHARSTPLPGIGRLVLVMDVTERKLLDKRQAEMDAHLQTVQRMEALGQLAGGIAHEINNMLHPIRTFAKAALVAETEDIRAQRISRVVDCADKAGEIVGQTLKFARESDRDLAVLDLVDLVRRTINLFRDMRLRDLELNLDLPTIPVRAMVNETEFTQVMLNLFQNAADAMGTRGTIAVTLSVAGDDRARIVIRDSGPGMPREVADRIFEPFFTTKGMTQGTGLGLSVVYGIINRWHGEIGVDTAPGKGTAITIRLPLAAG